MTNVSLITGASRGLGAGLAEVLSKNSHVVAVARTVGGLESLDDRIKAAGGQATLAPMDITDDGAMQHLCRMIHDRWGGVDLWAHTAIHAAPLSPSEQIDTHDWQKSWDTNVDATRRLIAYAAPLLRARSGRAVFFDDPRGGESFFGAYGATKAAQIGLARSWAAETARLGQKVNIVTPTPFSGATRARFFPGEDSSELADPRGEAERLLKILL